jgi:hypothetical protein
MGFRVEYPDGSQAFAEDVGTLRAWQLNGRLGPNVVVHSDAANRRLEADELAALLAQGPERGAGPGGAAAPESPWPLVATLFWCAAALVLHFGFGGWGFIIAGLSVFDGFRLKVAGSRWANAVLAVSVLTLAALLVSHFSRA